MNRNISCLIYVFLLSLTPAFAGATEFISADGGGHVADSVYDDLFITGNKIKMESYIQGDLFAFCQEMVHSDSYTVAGNLNAFCAQIQVLGRVGESLRGFGYSINCNAPVGRNALLFGNDVTVGPKAEIEKNADIFCGKLIFNGDLKGNLKVKAGEADISGHIGGNVEFEDGTLRIGPDAVIEGDLIYKSSQKAEISRGAVIYGDTNWEEIESHDKGTGTIMGEIFAWVFSARGYLLLMSAVSIVGLIFSVIPLPSFLIIVLYSIIFLISGNIMILLSRSRMMLTIDAIEKKFLPSLGLGFVLFFVVPVVSLVILLTLVGAPLGITLLFLFGAALFISVVYSAAFLGWKIWEKLGKNPESRSGHLCYSTGIVILIILSFIPFFGYLIITVAIMTGLGGLAQSLKTKSL